MSIQAVYDKYGLSSDDLLGRGMEAEVYAYPPDRVLKVYPGTQSLTGLTRLQTFYDALEPNLLPYALPSIDRVLVEGDVLCTLEKHLPGQCLAALLPDMTLTQLEAIFPRYLAAVQALSKVNLPGMDGGAAKLFDADQLEQGGDWHAFLDTCLQMKLLQVKVHLLRDVVDFEAKLAHLRSVLAQPYGGPYHLIHGDICPANLLVNELFEVTALLDFGVMTMVGDPLFDLATSWVFFDMYNELGFNLRERYLRFMLSILGETLRGKLYRYVLIYSILSANTYAPNCDDGHYEWCVANLNQSSYWAALT